MYLREGHTRDEKEVEFLRAVTDVLAGIIMRKRVEEELRESNRRLEETLAELRATQQQIIQQERLRALGQLASGIAHDFNNTLVPIVGYTDLMLTVPKILDDREKITSYLKLIDTAAKDAANIIDRLSEFYRSREESEVFVSVNINRLVEQVIELTMPKWKDHAQSSGVTITIQTDLQKVPYISGREFELREVLTNLIFNTEYNWQP